jgi:hypothetical protein
MGGIINIVTVLYNSAVLEPEIILERPGDVRYYIIQYHTVLYCVTL